MTAEPSYAFGAPKKDSKLLRILPNRDPETIELVSLCRQSFPTFCKTIFPDAFGLPFSPAIHDPIFDLLEDESKQQIVIAANRGAGKTSIFITYLAYLILFQKSHFVMVISHSLSEIMEHTENLKRELSQNEMIHKLFGGIETRENFAKDRWIAYNPATGIDTLVLPRGYRQQVRGWGYKYKRPSPILMDDLEDPKHKESDVVREAQRRWFYTDVCNAVDMSSNTWRILVIGTVIDQNALVQELLEDEDWEGERLELADANCNSNWPEFLSTEQIKKKYEAAKRRGLLDEFYLEFRNIPQAAEGRTFKPEHFRYYEEVDIKDNKDITNIIIVDPAREPKPTSADTAIVCMGVDMASGRVYVRKIENGKFHVEESAEKVLAMAAYFKTYLVAIEITGLGEEHATFPVKNLASAKGQFIQVIPLRSKTRPEDKKLRIGSFSHMYHQHLVYHCVGECGVLEEQELVFPKGKLIDVADAASRIVELMEEGNMLCPYNYGEPEKPGEDFDVDEQYYRQCHKEDMAMGPVGTWGVRL